MYFQSDSDSVNDAHYFHDVLKSLARYLRLYFELLKYHL